MTQPKATSLTSRPSSLNSSNNNNNKTPPPLSQLKQLQKITIGTKLAVYWPDDQEYYPCVVTRHRVKADNSGDPGELFRYTFCLHCAIQETVFYLYSILVKIFYSLKTVNLHLQYIYLLLIWLLFFFCFVFLQGTCTQLIMKMEKLKQLI
jgi:hypothetical protein